MTSPVSPHSPLQSDDAAPLPVLQPVDPRYLSVMRIGALMFYAPLAIGLIAADLFLIPRILPEIRGLISVLGILLALFAVLVLPKRSFARLAYAVTEEELRVVRGWLFHTDTIVPFVRIQHIDIGQGPVERSHGLSHLEVHTAGSANASVVVPGLSTPDAEAYRDAIRAHIKIDDV